MNIQMPVEDDIIPAVFHDGEFTHIDRQTLYDGYCLCCRGDNREPMSSRLFYEAVRSFLRLNPDLGVPEKEVQKRQGRAAGWVWIKQGYESDAKTNNEDRYIERDGYSRRWIGPVSG
jgi:hypothetical protein